MIVYKKLEKTTLNLLIGADWLANPVQVEEISKKHTAYVIYEVEDVHNSTINERKDFDFESGKALLSGAQKFGNPFRLFTFAANNLLILTASSLYADNYSRLLMSVERVAVIYG